MENNFVFENTEASAIEKLPKFDIRQYKDEAISIDDNSSIELSLSLRSNQNTNELTKKAINSKICKENNGKCSQGWHEYTKLAKLRYILFSVFKIIIFIILLYLFLLSLSFLSIGFTLISPYALKTEKIAYQLLKNPFGSLAIGILATAIMQNATATTSIVVTMVGVGIIKLNTAVSIIMGSNFGTCLTNILIALTVAKNPSEFKRAFSAAIFNDLFNLLTIAILLPIEIFTNFLSVISQKMTELIPVASDEFQHVNFIAFFLDPVVDLFIKLDKEKVNAMNMNPNITELAFRCCSKEFDLNRTNENMICNKCDYWSMPMVRTLGDGGTGLFWIIVSLTIHLSSLFGIVKIFSLLIEGPISDGIRKVLNASLPVKWKAFNNSFFFIFSFQITLIVQSLDIVTATLVPLCSIGIVNLERTYVMTLGSNLGTTVTGILSALTQTGPNLKKSIEIALVYTFFNLFGIFLWLPISFMQYPKILGKKFSNLVFKYKWLTYVYLIIAYFVMPTLVFCLSLIPNWIGLGILFLPLVFSLSFYLLVKLLRKTNMEILPEKLKSFDWLPQWLISFEYWDLKLGKAKLRHYNDKSDSVSELSDDDYSQKNSKTNVNNMNENLRENLPTIIRKIATIETIIREA